MHAAPGVIAERDAGDYWDAIVALGVDPLFILAMFNHESTMGKFGMARSTHSWGNTRPPSFLVPHVGVDTNFSIYRDWLSGCRSTVGRLVAPDWVYHNRPAIRDIFIWPLDPVHVWAPVTDNNDPGSYLNTVIRDMNAWADEGANVPLQPPSGWQPPPIRVAYVHAGKPNRPGTQITVRKNIWHDTGNPGVGANAEMHRRYVHGGGGAESTSYQYVVDDQEIVALIPEGEKAHHALDPCNSESNGIELCINSDGDWNLTRWNGAWLGAQLEARGATIHQQHYDCTRKNCPAKLRAAGTWGNFLERIASFRTAPDVPWYLHLGGGTMAEFPFRLGFRSVVEGLATTRFPADPNSAALALVGEPREEEWQGVDGHAYQRCKRVVLHYNPANAAPWDVIFERSGAPLPERKP